MKLVSYELFKLIQLALDHGLVGRLQSKEFGVIILLLGSSHRSHLHLLI